MILRTSTSHEEGGSRDWSVRTTAFRVEDGHVAGLECQRVDCAKDPETGKMTVTPAAAGSSPLWRAKARAGSDFTLDADLVLLALGFLHPVHEGLLDGLGVEYDGRGNVRVDGRMATSVEGVFAAGDVETGPWLVVGAVAAGRRMARAVDLYLMGETALPDTPPLPDL